MAALGPQRLNMGKSPNNKGIEVGPSKAANQLTINPSTSPKRW